MWVCLILCFLNIIDVIWCGFIVIGNKIVVFFGNGVRNENKGGVRVRFFGGEMYI